MQWCVCEGRMVDTQTSLAKQPRKFPSRYSMSSTVGFNILTIIIKAEK